MPRKSTVATARVARGTRQTGAADHIPFEAIAARHHRELLRYLIRVLGHHADAEDACQETLLRAHRAYPSLPNHAHVRAWLFTIATRAAANLRRGGKRRAHASGIDPETLPAPMATHPADPGLRAALETLPLRQRAALMLRVFQDHSYAEIARSLECTPAAARANVYQAIKRLKRTWLPQRIKENQR